jgi:CheY-like chemotaxis protein
MATRVLLVEDEPAIRRTVAAFLRGLGFETLTASDADDARDLLQHVRPDIILTDERLPGTNGSELIDEIHDRPEIARTPVVLMSAYDEPPGHHADDFLSKPFDPDLLEAILRRHLPATEFNPADSLRA